MRAFLLRLTCFLLIQCTIGAVVWQLGRQDVQRESDHYLYALRDKQQILQDKTHPRLILVGGSNLAFGTVSPQLVNQFDRPVVNLGLHASIGLEPLLKMTEESVRTDDVVVLMPEYELMFDPLYFAGTPEIQKELVHIWPGAAKYLPPRNQEARDLRRICDKEALYLLHESVVLSAARFQAIQKRCLHGAVDTRQVYRRSGFNQYGDLISHYGRPSTTKLKCLHFSGDIASLAPFVARINAFADFCQRRGAQVYLAYPPVSVETMAENRESLQDLDQHLATHLRVPILFGPGDSVFPQSRFFDTPYHLTREGAE